VQATAAQCRQVRPFDGVVSRGAGTALDHDAPFGTELVQNAPQGRLTDAKAQATPDLGLAQPLSFSKEDLENSVAAVAGHANDD
jgi:hypothetical protein